MIIEFFGFPGSGKTTICNRLVRELKKNDLKVIRGTFDHFNLFRRITCKLFYSFLCFFCNPIFFMKNAFYFSGIKNDTRISLSDFLNVTYLYSRYFFFRNTDNIIVFDQGMVQAYWSILAFTGIDMEKHNTKYFFEKLDIVVVLELELEKNKTRLFSRNDSGSRVQRDSENIESYFEKFLEVKRVLNEVNMLNKLCIDSGMMIEENITELLEKILINKASTSKRR